VRFALVVIGAGPAGLAAAISAKKAGIDKVLVIDRDSEAGGILNQCIHSGFGLSYFKQELTGPEYAERFILQAKELGVDFLFDTMALSVSPTAVKALNIKDGFLDIQCKAVILAMGCRERTRFAIAVPGTRPSGVITAGLAQRYINIEGRMIGKRVVILGSGDIGLIMARRLTLEGAEVIACVEIMPYSSGLTRNIAQCLDDFDIPLMLSHTVTGIHGSSRLKGITVAKVDDKMQPVKETEQYITCDTLLLSVGLIPENELSEAAGVLIDAKTRGPVIYDNNETSIPGIFACGNVLQVHDLADNVSNESERTGQAAAEFILKGQEDPGSVIAAYAGENVSYVLPQKIRLNGEKSLEIYMRVKRPIKSGYIVITCNGEEVKRTKRTYLTPGEMEHLSINTALISSDITVDIKERND